MALCNIITGSPWLSVDKENITVGAVTASSLIVNTETVGTLTVSDHEMIGNSTQTNSSYLTVGSASQLKGITMLNNLSGYVASDLNTYMESSQTITYISESGVISVNCSNDYRRIGKVVTLYLGGFTMIDAGSTRWQSRVAIPAIYRPGADIYSTCVANFNNIPKIGYMKVGTDGIILLQFDFSTSGGTNGLLNATVTYNV